MPAPADFDCRSRRRRGRRSAVREGGRRSRRRRSREHRRSSRDAVARQRSSRGCVTSYSTTPPSRLPCVAPEVFRNELFPRARVREGAGQAVTRRRRFVPTVAVSSDRSRSRRVRVNGDDRPSKVVGRANVVFVVNVALRKGRDRTGRRDDFLDEDDAATSSSRPANDVEPQIDFLEVAVPRDRHPSTLRSPRTRKPTTLTKCLPCQTVEFTPARHERRQNGGVDFVVQHDEDLRDSAVRNGRAMGAGSFGETNGLCGMTKAE